MELRTIMYIGRKDRKDDRVNGDIGRIWPGTGTTVEGIPATQAAKLVAHKDEFIDVTDLDAEALAARGQKAIADREEVIRTSRAEGRRIKLSGKGGLLLEHASEEQLEAQLSKLRANRGLRDQVVSEAEPTKAQENLSELSTKQTQDKTFLAEKVPEAMEAVFEKNDPDLLDEKGLPTRAALEEELGFTLTEEDYADALGANDPQE